MKHTPEPWGHGLLIVPAGTLGMDMGGGCSEKDNVACA